MSMAEVMLAEFEHEMSVTRRVLERVQDEHLDWQPHSKSMTFRRLASHTAKLPWYVAPIVGQDELDVDPATHVPFEGKSVADILDAFDQHVASAKEALQGQSDGHMMEAWRLKAGEAVVFELPRAGAIRVFVMSHMIHHRGQISVFLRLKDVAVPSVYGPSADEG